MGETSDNGRTIWLPGTPSPPGLNQADLLWRLESVMADLAGLFIELKASLAPGNRVDCPLTSDRLLTVEEVADRLGLSRSHVYKQAHRWPFTRKLSPKVLRFSEVGLEQWINSANWAKTTPPLASAQ